MHTKHYTGIRRFSEMLKDIDPLLRGELLKALDELGHGEEVALVDRNFPAYGVGVQVVDLGEVNCDRASTALFSVLPLDEFGDSPIIRMGIDGQPRVTNGAHDSVRENANASMGKDWQWVEVPRIEFYSRIREVRLVIRCLEDAPYACFIFRKGIV